MKDTCKQAVLRKDTWRARRAEDPLRAGDREKRELESFNNFCIDNGNAKPPQRYQHDSRTLMDFMNEQDSDDPHPLGILGDREHFIDIPEG